MSVFRSVLLIGSITLLASTGLFFTGFYLNNNERNSGYAVLSTELSIDDRYLTSLLTDNDLFEGRPVSESSLWVMLDNFEYLETVPLDMYFSRVHYFDPRYDGYAGKLRDVFIRDGKRFVFIPLKADSWNPKLLDRHFVSLLQEIPFTVNYYGIGRPFFIFFIIYASAFFCMLVICFVKNIRCKNPFMALMLKLLVLFPVFSSLAFFGASGIACAALFFAFFFLIKEPLSEFFSKSNSLFNGTSQRFKQYRYYIFLFPFFAAAFSIIIIFSQINVLFFLLVFFLALIVFFLSLKMQFISSGKHRRFLPVMIKKRNYVDFSFSLYVLPFVVAAFLTLFFSPFIPASYNIDNKFDFSINEQDYHTHLLYQASFSTRQMGEFSGNFPVFFFDVDGLPSMEIIPDNQAVGLSDFPPFPYQLRHLMDFFSGTSSELAVDHDKLRFNFDAEKLSLLVLLLFIIPLFLLITKKNYSIIRNTGKSRFMGINWNKSMLYNRGELHIKKKRESKKDA